MANPNRKGQLQPQGPEQQEWGWTRDGGPEMAHADSKGLEGRQLSFGTDEEVARAGSEGEMGDSECFGWEEVVSGEESQRSSSSLEYPSISGGRWWWRSEPDVGRVADGVAARVDRITALGNGQVPRVAATAWQLLQRRIKRC